MTAARVAVPGRTSANALRRRLVIGTGMAAAVAAALLVVTTQVVLARAGDATVERILSERADAVLATVEARTSDADDALPAVGPGDALYDDRGRLVAGRLPTSPRLRDRFGDLSRSTSPRFVGIDDDYRLLARPFDVEGRRGVLVLAESLNPYESDRHAAVALSVLSGAALVVVAMLVAGWSSRRALAPVQAMAATAREWSERDLERRFDLGAPTDEIRALGQVLDELLERVAAAIRAEQRLSAEMAHELRSPLTTIRATADLIALRSDLDPQLREDVADVVAACTAMSTTITVLLELARAGRAGERGDCTGDRLALDLRRGQGDVEVRLPPGLRIAAPSAVVLRALAPLVDNASRVAGRVLVEGRVAGGRVRITVSDDGPGVPLDVEGTLFEPGAGTTGSGLGLALARRVARACGGDVTLEQARGGPLGGATFVLDLPGHLA